MKTPRSVAVIGGQGKMGSLMARIFRETGLPVEIIDKKNSAVEWNRVTDHDAVVLATPLPVMNDVIRDMGPFTKQEGVVIDIGSIKQEPIQCMLSHCRGEVIGSHPLFGPATRNLYDQVVFVCPARSNHWLGWYNSVLKSCGARVVEIDPAEHDRLMAIVQVLRHLLVFSFGHSLMSLGFNLSSDLPVSGAPFSNLFSILRQQAQQGPEIYDDLAKANSHTYTVVRQVAESVKKVSLAYYSDDRTLLYNLVSDITYYLDRNTN